MYSGYKQKALSSTVARAKQLIISKFDVIKGELSDMSQYSDNPQDAAAQYLRGKACEIERNFKEADEWYLKSAEQGYSPAQVRLGERCPGKAEYWYLKAAEQGDTTAMARLGWLYEHDGNYSGAFKWYLKGSELGDFRAMQGLASLYDLGRGVEEDPFKARDWLNRCYRMAVANGSTSQYELQGIKDLLDLVNAHIVFWRR